MSLLAGLGGITEKLFGKDTTPRNSEEANRLSRCSDTIISEEFLALKRRIDARIEMEEKHVAEYKQSIANIIAEVSKPHRTNISHLANSCRELLSDLPMIKVVVREQVEKQLPTK